MISPRLSAAFRSTTIYLYPRRPKHVNLEIRAFAVQATSHHSASVSLLKYSAAGRMGVPTSVLPSTYRSYHPPPPHSLPNETVRTVLGILLLIGAVTGAYYW